MREEDAFPLGRGGLYEPLGSAQALGAPMGFAMCGSKWRPQEKYEVQGKRYGPYPRWALSSPINSGTGMGFA